MLKKILIVVVVLIAGFAIFVATRPNTYHVERTATMAAPPHVIYPMIDDFHRWQAWSPWEKLDPAMKREFTGAPSGEGAIYQWAGNDEVGEGRMTVTEARPVSVVGIKLEFLKPWEATSQTTFTIDPEADGSKVVWSMDGNHNFISKTMCLFIPMDQMVGPDFEKGLAQMKSIAEASPTTKDTTAVAS